MTVGTTMKCNSIVMVKQVPDTSNISGEVMKPDGTVNRAKLPTVFNPDDKVALELALQLRDRFGGRVTAITMGPAKAGELLRECLYMGADEVCLITDRQEAWALRLDFRRPPGNRWRYRASRTADRRKTADSADHVRGGDH
jgi:electron transfer flavoprotein alpha/beta subunit